jgi:hypothetical protein
LTLGKEIMLHHGTKTPVAVEELDGQLCVKLYNWGDTDWLEDRLNEDFEIGEIWKRSEEKEDGAEVFFLILSEAKDRSVIQAILNKIE